MKRFVVALLLFALLGAATVRAGEITLWHSYRGEEQAALETLVQQWNQAHPQTPVRPLVVAHEAYANKLTASIPRGQGPDVFIFAHERIADWAGAHLIRPLDDEFTPAAQAQFFPVTTEALRVRGRIYGVPLAFKSVALIYNKALLATPPATTDELVAYLTKRTDRAAKVLDRKSVV